MAISLEFLYAPPMSAYRTVCLSNSISNRFSSRREIRSPPMRNSFVTTNGPRTLMSTRDSKLKTSLVAVMAKKRKTKTNKRRNTSITMSQKTIETQLSSLSINLPLPANLWPSTSTLETLFIIQPDVNAERLLPLSPRLPRSLSSGAPLSSSKVPRTKVTLKQL